MQTWLPEGCLERSMKAKAPAGRGGWAVSCVFLWEKRLRKLRYYASQRDSDRMGRILLRRWFERTRFQSKTPRNDLSSLLESAVLKKIHTCWTLIAILRRLTKPSGNGPSRHFQLTILSDPESAFRDDSESPEMVSWKWLEVPFPISVASSLEKLKIIVC